jgi:hypothetical protein
VANAMMESAACLSTNAVKTLASYSPLSTFRWQLIEQEPTKKPLNNSSQSLLYLKRSKTSRKDLRPHIDIKEVRIEAIVD